MAGHRGALGCTGTPRIAALRTILRELASIKKTKSMPPKKARFGNSRGGKCGGKGRGGSYGRYDGRGYYDHCSCRDHRGSDWSHCDYLDDPHSWGYGGRGSGHGPSTPVIGSTAALRLCYKTRPSGLHCEVASWKKAAAGNPGSCLFLRAPRPDPQTRRDCGPYTGLGACCSCSLEKFCVLAYMLRGQCRVVSRLLPSQTMVSKAG